MKNLKKISVLLTCLLGMASGAYAEDAAMLKLNLGKPPQLKVALTPESRCSFGDLDVIALDAEQGETKLQLSIEEFGGKGGVFYGKPVEDKNAGYNYTVDLPVYKKPTIFGLYLCSVKKDAVGVPCGSFPAKSYQELLSPYTVDITRAQVKDGKLGAAPLSNTGKNDPSGKIYFFKYIVIDGQGGIEFPSGRMNEDAYKNLAASIKKRGGKLDNADWQMTRLKLLGSTLGSEPLTIKDGKYLSCTLPFYDKTKCTK